MSYENWRPGISIVPAGSTTHLQVHWHSADQWKEPHIIVPGEKAKFHMLAADVDWSVHKLIDRLMKIRKGQLNEGPDGGLGWAVTEWTEAGDGKYLKGSTFIFEDEKAKNTTLKAVGWTEKRGRELPPVVLQLHRADEKFRAWMSVKLGKEI